MTAKEAVDKLLELKDVIFAEVMRQTENMINRRVDERLFEGVQRALDNYKPKIDSNFCPCCGKPMEKKP